MICIRGDVLARATGFIVEYCCPISPTDLNERPSRSPPKKSRVRPTDCVRVQIKNTINCNLSNKCVHEIIPLKVPNTFYETFGGHTTMFIVICL